MLALYRCGRQAEALSAFRQLRAQLVEELGVEPGPQLQRLHGRILAGDPALDAPDSVAPAGRAHVTARPRVTAWARVPRQLPLDVNGFTGRAAELSRLRGPVPAAPGPGPSIVAINGGGGTGKSALAIHAAHRLARQFRAGQLYADLQGAAPELAPVAPLVVLGRFLRALGADDGDIADLAEAAARYRAATCGRRLLVLLDNARDAAQVRPLLPASPTCLTLVTSRQVLASLDGAEHLHLDVLPPDDAVRLLHQVAGRERSPRTDAAAERVVRSCGYLPLAVRIAGARLAARPHWTVPALAARLAGADRRLDELQVHDMDVRRSLRVSLQLLRGGPDAAGPAAGNAFGLLGLPDGPDISLPAAARLLDSAEPVAERIMERLVDARLVDSVAPVRYRMPELLRHFARENVDRRLAPVARAAILVRLWEWYAAAAWQAHRLIHARDIDREPSGRRRAEPVLPVSTAADAMRWLDTERANLVAAVRQAAGTEGVPVDVPVSLARALSGYLLVRGHWQAWTEVTRIARGLPSDRVA
jgi:hypothetical protein